MTHLRQRFFEDMKIRNLAITTRRSYVFYVSQLARYFGRSPDVLGQEQIRAYQLYLTQEKKLAPASIIAAVSALRFLYKVTLRQEWNIEEMIPSPKMPKTYPSSSAQSKFCNFSVVSLNKARRGELVMRPPIGLIHNSEGRLVLDPDKQVQDAVRLLLDTFRRTGSAMATVRTFRQENLLLPRRVHQGPQQGDVVWGVLGLSQVRVCCTLGPARA